MEFFYSLFIAFSLLLCCAGQTYSRNWESLTSIPGDIPANTTVLNLRNNLLDVVASGKLLQAPLLVKIDLSANKFVQFPNLCDAGTTLTTVVMQRSYSLNTFPNLECLVKLNRLDLYKSDIGFWPDLSPIGDTLTWLSLRYNKINQLNASFLANFTKLTHLNIGNNLFTEVPDLSAVGRTLLQLTLSHNQITHIPCTAWQNMTALNKLWLEWNLLTSFPDLRHVGNTLTDVYVDFNPISNYTQEYINALTKLQRIGLGGQSLNYLPALDGFGQSLLTLRVVNTNLTSAPLLINMSALQSFTLNGNTLIQEIPYNYFLGWDSLKYLDLTSVPLQEFPNLLPVTDTLQKLILKNTLVTSLPVTQMALMTSLKDLDVRDTPISSIPVLCSVSLSALSISLQNSNVDVCHCDNLWLKLVQEKGGKVGAGAGVQCKGQDWKAFDLKNMTNECSYEEMHYSIPSVAMERFFCKLPLRTPVHIRHLHCTMLCRQTPGCTSFNFEPSGDSQNGRQAGQCVIVAPSVDNETHISPANTDTWKWYRLNM